MNVQIPTQYTNSLDYRSRLIGMRDLAAKTLSPQDLQTFLTSIQPLIETVDKEIDELETSITTALLPAWRLLGEFVLEDRIPLNTPDNVTWNAIEFNQQKSYLNSYIDLNQLPLFAPNRQTHSYLGADWLSLGCQNQIWPTSSFAI